MGGQLLEGIKAFYKNANACVSAKGAYIGARLKWHGDDWTGTGRGGAFSAK